MKLRIVFLLLTLLTGCQTNINSDYYKSTSVGSVNRAVKGTVISARPVKVYDDSGTGASSGATLGAIGGASSGNNLASSAAFALTGAVAGGLAGSAIEHSTTRQGALEYVVESTNGALLTVVQGGPNYFHTGDSVLVIYGSPSRIIPLQRTQ
jgi:outer membrane lipoprotein SlyB